MHFIDKLKTFVVPNSNHNNYKDDFVDENSDYDSENIKNAAPIILLVR